MKCPVIVKDPVSKVVAFFYYKIPSRCSSHLPQNPLRDGDLSVSEANPFMDIKIFYIEQIYFLQLPHFEIHVVWYNKSKTNPYLLTRLSESSRQLSHQRDQ